MDSVSRLGASSICGWRRPSAGMKKSCDYIKQAILDSRQGAVLEKGLGEGDKKFILKEHQLLSR
jgi:hypothetical protein